MSYAFFLLGRIPTITPLLSTGISWETDCLANLLSLFPFRIALALVRAGHEVYGTTRSAESAKKLEAEESE